MKTLEERAKEACVAWCDGECDNDIYEGCFVDGFIEGVESERAEMTRWRDPKKELPEPYKTTLIKYGEYSITAAWLAYDDIEPFWTICGTDIVIENSEVLGWRPIIEEER